MKDIPLTQLPRGGFQKHPPDSPFKGGIFSKYPALPPVKLCRITIIGAQLPVASILLKIIH